MAEPCCDTSSFSRDVVLASHQIKHSYALLLVYIHIHNVFPFLILSFYLGSASCTPFLTQPFCLPFSHLIASYFVMIPGWGTSVNLLRFLVPAAEWRALKPRLMLEVAVERVFKTTTDAGTLLALESQRHLFSSAAVSIKSQKSFCGIVQETL